MDDWEEISVAINRVIRVTNRAVLQSLPKAMRGGKKEIKQRSLLLGLAKKTSMKFYNLSEELGNGNM